MSKHPNYELFEAIGRSENSVVHRAWDLLLSRDVAIKELSTEPGSDGGQSASQRITQFLKEASFLAQFEHEHVLRIHTVDQDRGWIVMELMKGSLASQIAAEPMQPDTVRSVLRQILSALDFLHKKNKVHGSVRPSNILINDQGTVKLSDFEASGRDAELRVPKGTKKYLAPELIRPEFGEFGPAVDLYCLGFTALELLTATKFDSLFPGTGDGAIDADVAWLRWHSSDEPMLSVKELAPGVPDDLAGVIDQLLNKNVDQRPEDAAAVLKLLDDSPLIPVEVIAPVTKAMKKQDPAAILPSKAVKLRQPATKKKSNRKKPAAATTAKSKLNETLGKPYILWPICIGMLAGAAFIGLHLRGDRDKVNVDPIPIVDVEQPKSKNPEPEALAVMLKVLPDAEQATLMVAGEPREFDDLRLLPGRYEIVVEKEGFKPFTSSLDIDKDNMAFDITLKEIVTDPIVAKPTPKQAKLIDVQIAVYPLEAELTVDGELVDFNNGPIQIDPKAISDLELVALADGYKPKTARWSLDELAELNYDIELTLEKTPTDEIEPNTNLPESLIPKSGTAYDKVSGLPQQVLVKKLKESAPMELVLVSAGDYQFGATEGALRTWELPGQTINIGQPFYIGLQEVTSAQYMAFASDNSGADTINADQSEIPITGLSIRQAAEFCDWVGGRLPTEREWEAAVRAPNDSGYPLPWSKNKTDHDLDEDKCKLFRGESDSDLGLAQSSAMPNGANQLGLLNTIGNAAEWCSSQHSADQFIIKGCSYKIPPGDHVRVSWRNSAKWTGAKDIGMRLMIPIVEEPKESPALSFVPPTNIDSLLVSTGINDENENTDDQVYTKTVNEIANEFTGPAELVIDSGGFMDEISDVSFSPDGKKIAVGGGKLVRIWDAESGNLLETLRGDMSRTSYGNVNAVTWSPDGQFLLVGVSDYRDHGNIRVYSTENLNEIENVLKGHTAPCRKLTFSRDGKYLASVDADGLMLVRNWETKEIQHQIAARDRDQPIFDLMKFPTDEPYLLGIDFEGPQTYSALTGKRLGANDNMPSDIRGWLVDIYNNLVKFPFGVKAQPRVMDFRMEEGRWAGAGNAVVDGRSKFWIRVWESREPVSSAIPTKELAGYDKHRWNITAISLQPRGSLVASGDKFGEVHVWDSNTGKRKFKFAGQGKPIYEVAFDKTTSRIAFGTKPHLPKDWKRNNHGVATRILDLRQRAIVDVATREDIQLQREVPTIGEINVNVRKKDAFYFVEQLFGTQVRSKYRISSGRNPTAFTLLDAPKLGVQQPVVFGDNEGLLALWDTAGDELKRAFIGHGNLVSAISAASNGKLIATASTDRTIRLWSLEDYRPTGIFDFKFENSAVRELVPGTSSAEAGVQVGDKIVSIDGLSLTKMFELMLLGEFDYKPGQVVPVKMKRGEESFEYEMTMTVGYDFSEPVLNFYMGDDGQWIIWHPQGYYDASPGADRLIGWHLNRGHDKSATFFEVQQFREKLYRPDVIDGILESGSLKSALASMKTDRKKGEEIDFRKPEVIAEHHPPSVRITAPNNAWQTETASVTVTGEANSVNGLPLTALTLLHNGSVAKVFRPTRTNQLSMKIEYEMSLQPGANDLVLIAANSKSSSQGKHIVVDLNQPTQFANPNAIVLAIGVSEFDQSLQNLPQAASDAKAFADAMKQHENGKLYGKVKTKILSNNVTDNEVVEGFEWLADNTNDGDVAMVFIASHAMVDRRDNFFIGTTNTVETKARSTAVSWRDLTDTLQLDLPDSKRMVFLDLKPTKNSIRPGLRNPLLDLAAPEMGTIFLSSNTLQQISTKVASTTGRGAFLQAVLETVSNQKFDTNPSGDALFNPTELAAGVMTRVKDLTQDQQQPVFFTPEYAKFANVLELRN